MCHKAKYDIEKNNPQTERELFEVEIPKIIRKPKEVRKTSEKLMSTKQVVKLQN